MSQSARSKLSEILYKKIPIDFNGHFEGLKTTDSSSTALWARAMVPDYLTGYLLPTDDAERLLDHWENNKKLDTPVKFNSTIIFKCDVCGNPIEFSYDGIKITADLCPYPNGYPAIEFDLNCSSGKIVVANDLRDLFVLIDSFNINNTPEEARCTYAYEKIGLAHGFVGNTCPGVFAYGNKPYKNFLIGNPKQNRKTIPGPNKERSRKVSGIGTDLWWYSICDHDEFIRRLNGTPPDNYQRYYEVVDVKPGVYHFKQVHHLIKDEDYQSERIYCFFDWVQEPDPVVDLGKKYRELDFTAEQVIGDHMARWGRDVIDAISCFMCVNGTGIENHPNGWIGSTQNVDTSKAVVLPELKGPNRWYPLCKYCNLAKMSGLNPDKDFLLNPSFVRLAFNVVKNILLDGVITMDSFGSETTEERREELRTKERAEQSHWAWHIYLGLKQRYSNQIPEDCQNLPKPEIEKIDERPK